MTTKAEQRTPIVLGIVGGIASGKSEVTRLLGERNGTIISADAIAHRVLLEPEVIDELVEIFGTRILQLTESVETRVIDRAKLGSEVFGESEDKRVMRKRLESVVHPRIRQFARSELEVLKEDLTIKWIILDAPLLIEGGWLPYCDRVIMVESPDALRQKRALERGWTKQQWIDRESAQLNLAEKRKYATDILVNDGTLALLKQQVDDLVAKLQPKN